jgi:DNA primase
LNYENPVEEIKNRSDIVEVIQRFVPLKRAGRNWKGICPFHHEKTPSFIVFPDSSSYHCFGCGRSGDVFRFLMDVQGKEFKEILTDLARQYGVELHVAPERKAAKETEDLLYDLNSVAAHYYHQILMQATSAEAARNYLDSRGIAAQTRQEFLLGFTQDGWDGLTKYLSDKGHDLEKAASIGLLMTRESGGYYDRFRKRIMFPIRDAEGHIRGFGGRSIDGAEPKYLNSPESSIFAKGSLLYGLDAARQNIRNLDAVVVVEGYTDALMAHQSGFRNVVASMGTAIVDKQIFSLKKLTKNFILALDADNAGDLGMLRGLEVIRTSVEHLRINVRTSDGRVIQGFQPGVSIRVAVLPRGKDPCDVIKEDPAEWTAALESAKPVTDYAINLVASHHDLQSASGKSDMVREIAPVVAQVADPVEKAHYLQKVAHLAQVEERVVESAIARHTVPQSVGPPGASFPTRREKPGLEARLVGLLIAHPDLLTDENQAKLADLIPVEYNLALGAAIHARGPEGIDYDEFSADLGAELEDFGQALLRSISEDVDFTVEQAKAAFENIVMRLERARLNDKLRLYEFMAQEADESGNQDEAARLKGDIAILASEMSRYDPRPSTLFKDHRSQD